MEVINNHPYTKARQRHLSRIFISAHLASLPSRKSLGNSDPTNHQQISLTCSRTRTLDHLSPAAVNNRHCNGIQPEEAPRSYGLRGRRFICCVWQFSITSCCQRSTDHSSLRPQWCSFYCSFIGVIYPSAAKFQETGSSHVNHKDVDPMSTKYVLYETEVDQRSTETALEHVYIKSVKRNWW